MSILLILACNGGPEPDDSAPGAFTPQGRSGSVGFVSDDAASLHVAGGRLATGPTEDTLVLDLATGAWAAGPPSELPLHRAGLVPDTAGAVVFGGTTDFDQETDTTWAWQPGNDTPWQERPTGPPARSWHGVAAGLGQLWLYGGRQDDGDVLVFEDLWAYDLGSGTWTEQTVPPGGPGARYRHALCWANGLLWLHGGLDADDDRRDDLWSLDVSGQQWTLQDHSGPFPEARASHSLEVVGEMLWLFGGDPGDTSVWRLTPGSTTWEEVAQDDGPAARDDHLAAATPDGTAVILFGGDLADQELAGDAWRWEAGAWTRIEAVR